MTDGADQSAERLSDVERFYDANTAREWGRLERFRTEHAVTLRALREYLPPAPATLIDIGGGPGRYAIELTKRGYGVILVDLSQEALAMARARMEDERLALGNILHASATDLSVLPDERFDAALLLGPLYHLLSLEERERAISEARRVLRPAGVLFAAFITRFAPVRWAAMNDPMRIVERPGWPDDILTDGVSYSARFANFTHAYYAHPTEVRPLVETNGFTTLDLIGCEGVVSMIDERVNALEGPAREAWADLNYQLGKDPSLHGAAEHLLYVGQKRENSSNK